MQQYVNGYLRGIEVWSLYDRDSPAKETPIDTIQITFSLVKLIERCSISLSFFTDGSRAAVTRHTYFPMIKGERPLPHSCWLHEQGDCFIESFDPSSLPKPFRKGDFTVLLEKGEESLWEELEKLYQRLIKNGRNYEL